MSSIFQNSLLQADQRLFRVEIRASIAHCNGLFHAAILTRPEAERLKNALWTILKRADFDQHFLNQADVPDVYTFVETKLFQLVNDACYKLNIGRSVESRSATALRLWVRDELETLSELLDNLHEELLQAATKSRLLAVFDQGFERDRERLTEILRRTNQMPRPQVDAADETIGEIDFAEIAHELGFANVLENSLDAIFDRDFCVEFSNAAALIMLHNTNLGNALLQNFDLNPQQQRVFEMMRGKSSKITGLHAASLSILKNLSLAPVADLDEIHEIIFETSEILKSCVQAATATLRELA